ncbi:hypothetical protein TSUD_59880 [Trifolium subterraneum]|uniref:Uncharacterized protein n=1 Tax=Trifolium subterraneum TaxID=3900 RepID=A0A2Z6NRH4_TRISU|nr:hypothetical protein TSUD_59880 [Trifolium subterraneum]
MNTQPHTHSPPLRFLLSEAPKLVDREKDILVWHRIGAFPVDSAAVDIVFEFNSRWLCFKESMHTN